ncbi:TIGR03086 family protein [Candidatus Saccharibacteria bacterium]|nr:TIGR03086 family protein [Candidatus Saccharibacteria bacterium]
MSPSQALKQACEVASKQIDMIKPGQWHVVTPNTDWDLTALVKHMVYEVLWVPDLVEGKTVKEVGDKYDGDILGKDAKKAWLAASQKAVAAFTDPGAMTKTVHLSYANVMGEHYCSEIASDVFIHSWDVAKAVDTNTDLDKELAEFTYKFMQPRAAEMRQSGLFGSEVKVANDADLQTKLLALYGRRN